MHSVLTIDYRMLTIEHFFNYMRYSLLIFSFIAISSVAIAQPSPPQGLVQRSGDLSVILHWDANPEGNIKGYRIYRTTDTTGTFTQPVAGVFRDPHFVDFNVQNDRVYFYRIQAIDQNDQASDDSAVIETAPRELTDEAFIDLVQQTAFDYFWYEANPENGLVKDRSTAGSASSIAAVGFGLSALTVGIDRGWISREAGQERVLNTLEFFWNSPQGPEADATGYKGFYYHFLDMQTGRRVGTTELSTIDTALLLGGVLHVGAYFDRQTLEDERIRNLADSIYSRVDWTWAQPRPPRIGHGWRPESGFIPFDWGGYNEAMIVYLLALGSPTHPVAPEAWTSWTSSYKWQTHFGQQFVVFPPLFGHQYTHIWYDFRDLRDAYMRGKNSDYFRNSRRATLANRAYAISNPENWSHFGANEWGLTASDIPNGYAARGAPPAQNDEGTIAPTAAGGSFAFTPDESLAALRHMYNTYRIKIWHRYGFRDAYNPAKNWFAPSFLGIDQGPFVLMIENHRTGNIWDRFMQLDAVQAGLQRAGFATSVGVEDTPHRAKSAILRANYPNPFARTTHLVIDLKEASMVKLKIYDALGRQIATPINDYRAAGRYELILDLAEYGPGIYVAMLEAAGTVETIRLVKAL